MLRAAKFSVEIILDAVKDLMFFDDTGELKSLSQNVWNDASVKCKTKCRQNICTCTSLEMITTSRICSENGMALSEILKYHFRQRIKVVT